MRDEIKENDGDRRLRLDRNAAAAALAETVAGASALVVGGQSGVGKSALALGLSATDAADADRVQALCINLRHVHKLTVEFKKTLGCPLSTLFCELSAPQRMLVIDGADAVAEGSADALRYIVDAAHASDVNVVALASVNNNHVVRDTLSDRFGADIKEHAVAPLTDTELNEIVKISPRLALGRHRTPMSTSGRTLRSELMNATQTRLTQLHQATIRLPAIMGQHPHTNATFQRDRTNTPGGVATQLSLHGLNEPEPALPQHHRTSFGSTLTHTPRSGRARYARTGESTVKLRIRPSERLPRNAKPVRNPANPARVPTAQLFAHRRYVPLTPLLALPSSLGNKQTIVFRAEPRGHELLDAKGPHGFTDSGSLRHLKSSYQGGMNPITKPGLTNGVRRSTHRSKAGGTLRRVAAKSARRNAQRSLDLPD